MKTIDEYKEELNSLIYASDPSALIKYNETDDEIRVVVTIATDPDSEPTIYAVSALWVPKHVDAAQQHNPFRVSAFFERRAAMQHARHIEDSLLRLIREEMKKRFENDYTYNN